MKESQRRRILESHELLFAPRSVQRDFWSRYNRGGSARRAARLGTLVEGVLEERLDAASQRHARLAAAWDDVVPETFRGAAQVEAFDGRRLRITVDSAATKYTLGRLAQTLIAALNECLGGATVKRIDFCIDSFARYC